MAKSGLRVIKDDIKKVLAVINALEIDGVAVGVPESKNSRKDKLGNAAIAYIQNNGSPKQGIPARPFMDNGIAESAEDVALELKNGALGALASGDPKRMTTAYNRAGLVAQNAIRAAITDGDGFDALEESTLAARRARGRTGTKPLIDTGQLRRSITYVVGKRG
jgi:hypothetical protein